MDSYEDIERLKANAIKAIEKLQQYSNIVGTVQEAEELVQHFFRLADEYERIYHNYEYCMDSLISIYEYAEINKDLILMSLIDTISDKLNIPND